MALSITIRTDLDKEAAFWDGVPTVTRRAAAQALTQHAKNSLQVQKSELGKDIDKPNPFTRNAFVSYGAAQNRLESGVFIKKFQAEYLARLLGAGLKVRRPQAKFIFVPARSQRRDSYGNLSRAKRRNILNDPTLHFTDRGAYKVAYVRKGKTRVFVGAMMRQTKYRGKYFNFFERAERHYSRTFSKTYGQVFNRVLTRYNSSR